MKLRIIRKLKSFIDSHQKTIIIDEHHEEIKKRVESHFELAALERYLSISFDIDYVLTFDRVKKTMAEEEHDLDRLY